MVQTGGMAGQGKKAEKGEWEGAGSLGPGRERVGKARVCAWVRMGREGGEGGEMLGASWMYTIRDMGRLGYSAGVGGSQGDGLVKVRAEGEAV